MVKAVKLFEVVPADTLMALIPAPAKLAVIIPSPSSPKLILLEFENMTVPVLCEFAPPDTATPAPLTNPPDGMGNDHPSASV